MKKKDATAEETAKNINLFQVKARENIIERIEEIKSDFPKIKFEFILYSGFDFSAKDTQVVFQDGISIAESNATTQQNQINLNYDFTFKISTPSANVEAVNKTGILLDLVLHYISAADFKFLNMEDTANNGVIITELSGGLEALEGMETTLSVATASISFQTTYGFIVEDYKEHNKKLKGIESVFYKKSEAKDGKKNKKADEVEIVRLSNKVKSLQKLNFKYLKEIKILTQLKINCERKLKNTIKSNPMENTLKSENIKYVVIETVKLNGLIFPVGHVFENLEAEDLKKLLKLKVVKKYIKIEGSDE